MEPNLTNPYLQQIEAVYTQPIRSAEVIKSGWSNVVVDVNQEIIFRFIRHPSPQFELEKAFLKAFSPISPVSIPTPSHEAFDFIAYPRLTGERFAPEAFSTLSSEGQNILFIQLGQFLSALHHLDFDHANLNTDPYGGGDFWQELWEPAEPLLDSKTAIIAKAFFENKLERIQASAFQPCLVHSDLGTNNLLVDFGQPSLTGIIDFSDLAWGDPAVDFAGFYRNFGRDFVERLLGFYDRPLGDRFWDRLEFQSIRKQFFVIYFARKFRFESHIPAVVKSIEKLLSTLNLD